MQTGFGPHMLLLVARIEGQILSTAHALSGCIQKIHMLEMRGLIIIWSAHCQDPKLKKVPDVWKKKAALLMFQMVSTAGSRCLEGSATK